MKKISIIYSVLFTGIVFAACSGSSTNEQRKDAASLAMPATDSSGKMMSSVKYTCKMHPQVISDTPGHCPKCGMEMVPMKAGMMHDSTHMHGDSMMK